MDAQLKTKWIEALRSGKYPQGTGAFKIWGGAYCCLGVLCEIGRQTQDIRSNWDFCDDAITVGGTQVLISMNDKDGKSFPEIADYIEANL